MVCKRGLYKGDTCTIYTDKVSNCSGYLVFGPDELEMHLNETDNKFACNYQTLNNKIMLSYYVAYKGANPKTEDVKMFYALKELQSGKDIILIRISDKDYK